MRRYRGTKDKGRGLLESSPTKRYFNSTPLPLSNASGKLVLRTRGLTTRSVQEMAEKYLGRTTVHRVAVTILSLISSTHPTRSWVPPTPLARPSSFCGHLLSSLAAHVDKETMFKFPDVAPLSCAMDAPIVQCRGVTFSFPPSASSASWSSGKNQALLEGVTMDFTRRSRCVLCARLCVVKIRLCESPRIDCREPRRQKILRMSSHGRSGTFHDCWDLKPSEMLGEY